MMLSKKKIAWYALILLLTINTAFAGPWILPGNLSVKSDIDLLADAGLIKAPVMTWPIAWVSIGPQLSSPETKTKLAKEPESVKQAYQRILILYKENYQPHHLQTSVYASGAQKLNPFRTFEYEPYADFATGAAFAYQANHFADSVNMSYYEAPNRSYSNYAHVDNSYAYLLLGNWAIGFDQVNRWWGPGYSDSLILSQNAEPIPTFTIQRMKAEAFQTKWLHWIGPWSLTSSLSSQFDGGSISNTNALIWLTNIAFRPIISLQFSLSQVSLFAGDARPLSWAKVQNLVTLQGYCYDGKGNGNTPCQDEPGKNHVETSALWSLDPVFSIPVDLYVQFAFDDAASISHSWGNHLTIPAKPIFLGGIDWINNFNAGRLKTYFEYENSQVYNYPFFTGGTYPNAFNFYGGSTNYPYTYYGSNMGSSLGDEAIAETLGFILNENDGNSDTAMLRYLDVNLYGGVGVGYPFQPQHLIWGSVGRNFLLSRRFGFLSAELGYLQSIKGSGLNSGLSAMLTWSKRLDF